MSHDRTNDIYITAAVLLSDTSRHRVDKFYITVVSAEPLFTFNQITVKLTLLRGSFTMSSTIPKCKLNNPFVFKICFNYETRISLTFSINKPNNGFIIKI